MRRGRERFQPCSSAPLPLFLPPLPGAAVQMSGIGRCCAAKLLRLRCLIVRRGNHLDDGCRPATMWHGRADCIVTKTQCALGC